MSSEECDHGVIFDEAEAKRLEKEALERGEDNYAFLSPLTKEIRRRWPRLMGECPKGCGFRGIAYASRSHYIYGDW